MNLLATTNVVQNIVSTLTDWVSSFVSLLSTTFTNVISIFYNSETGLTTLGVLGLMGIAIGLVYLAINFVRRAFHF